MNEINQKIKKLENSNLPFFGNQQKDKIFYVHELDKIIISMVDESLTEDIAKLLENFCDKNDILIDEILVLHSNILLEKDYSHSLDYFFMECKQLINTHQDYGIINTDDKERIYNCLNNSENKHRTHIVEGLKEKKLLKYGFVSYIDKGIQLPKSIEPKNLSETNFRWDTLLPGVVSKTYFNVVTETHNEIERDFNDLFITEKTCKALITQPFIIVGNYGTLKYLKKLGFKTYPELFDESYDLIENPKERMDFIINEIEKLCNMDEKKLEKICNSVSWRVKHNRKIMMEFPIDKFVYKYLPNYNTESWELGA